MASRHRRRTMQRPMEPFIEVAPNNSEEYLNRIRKHAIVSGERAETYVQAHLEQRMFSNDRYAVSIRGIIADDGTKMAHLSIKRIDRAVIDDWRDLQTIKNMIVGPERDAVQIFPRESHLVDTSNQYHLWVFIDDGYVLPFGFKERYISDTNETTFQGTRQRRFVKAE